MVHTDRTFDNSVAVVRGYLGNEAELAERLLHGRVMTVWGSDLPCTTTRSPSATEDQYPLRTTLLNITCTLAIRTYIKSMSLVTKKNTLGMI